MSDLKNKTIGGFRVLREIQAGSGSQGTVYKAVCIDGANRLVPSGTTVALKVMAVQDEGRSQWAKLQKRTGELVRMNSPNVVKYYGCFSESGLFNDVHVVVQEFLKGETLKERLARFPSGLDVDEALRIADAALSGLVYTSGCGITHRDIKPGNIFLCDDGAVKLIDFEIARQNGGTTTSSAGNIRGSFDYMAPDFTDAEFHGDTQSDVFSMGVVLHEMLTGKTPYQRLDGDDKQANFAFLSRWAHALTDGYNPIHVSSRINRLLAHTEEVMSRALAPKRAERYVDFESFREGLKAIRFRNLRHGQNAYQMLQFIGKGGFGEVFKARLRQTGQLVAVKHLLKADYAERFCREAKIMKKLHDPCFVQFIDFFVMDAGSSREAFLVMAFLDGMPGSSLRDAIRSADAGGLPKADVFRAFERYAWGLQVMHSEGIFHRDIKPSNLYFPPGHPEQAAIMDLGIARDVNGTATHGQVPGTLDYMPPEVVVTDSRGDGGMDIYALGLCFYEALTSKMAFPRLPTGTAAYTAFFDRAKTKKKPSFDVLDVQGDADLIALLKDMTNPELSLRLRDAATLVERIRSLRQSLFPDVPSDSEDELSGGEQSTQTDFGSDTAAETVALDNVTQGTVATQWEGGKLEALERERKIVQARRNGNRASSARPIVAAASLLAVALSVAALAYFARTPVCNRYAAKKLDEVIRAYQSGREDDARLGESVWRTQWNPESRNWLRLGNAEYVRLLGVLESAKKTGGEGTEDDKGLVLRKIEACRTPSGKLDEENFRKLDGWEIPDTLKEDGAIRRQMAGMGKCLAVAITEKLSVQPPLTRGVRIRKARELLGNSWSAKILSVEERNRLSKTIDDVSSWCVGIVKNNCETDIQLDGRTIAVGGSDVAVYKDGHPEKGVVVKKGCDPVNLPSDLNGRTFEVHEDTFVAKPVAVAFPKTESGVTCLFRGKAMAEGETVLLVPGNYECTYSKGETYEQQTVGFTVRANASASIPSPKAWVHTKEFVAKENERAKRERILRETPVDVAIADFGKDVTLLLDGKGQTQGTVGLKPGKHAFRYAKRDCVAQDGELVVSPGVAATLPMPGRWEKTQEAKDRERNAELKARRERVVETCRRLMDDEPIATRQARLAEAQKALTTAVAVDRIMTEGDAKPLEDEIGRKRRRVVGKVQNKCAGIDLTVGGRLVGAGTTVMLAFEDGLPDDWCCVAPGYEKKELTKDFDGRTMSIGAEDLVAKNVAVSLPALDRGVTCHFEGSPVSASLSLKPGAYSCVYRKDGFEDQVVRFSVSLGKDSTLPIPGKWTALAVKVSMPELPSDVICAVDGNSVRSALTLKPGEHVCEYRRTDYKTQTRRFEVVAATPMALPAVGEWEPSRGLQNLNVAEQHARQKDWPAAERALADAEVQSDANKARKAALQDGIRKQVGLRKKAEQAIEYYDNEYYGDAVKYYYEACKLGYSMSAEDKDRVKRAYDIERKRLQALIDWTYTEIKRGRSVDRSVTDIEKEKKTLFECYNSMK